MINKLIKKKLNYNPNLKNYQREYKHFSYAKEIKKFLNKDGLINLAELAVDFNAVNFRKNKVALYYEGDLGDTLKLTFLEISLLSNRVANLIKDLGVEKGERVFLFLPRIPELYFTFLGIIKTGAIAGTMFAAFQEQALLDRLSNSQAKVLFTTSELYPRVAKIRLKLPHLKKVILIDEFNRNNFINKQKLEIKHLPLGCMWFYPLISKVNEIFKIKYLHPNDPAFILYTSGTTGKPKGVMHRHLAIVHEIITAKNVLDIKDSDVYWCTADPGWVTGIAYEILGTWALGASTLVYSGRFDPEKWYSLIQNYHVNVWYTAPTAIRMLIASDSKLLKQYNLSSLRHLASVGEPLNPEAVLWSLKTLKLPFHDNYWQTETGGIVIANYPCLPIKPGSMGKPVPGIKAEIRDDQGKPVNVGKEGNLVLKPGWPSLMLKIWLRPHKFKQYFKNGWYFTGDRAFQDKDGYFWFIGRSDDVIKTGGERVGPFEVESALITHPYVVEAGVIGKPDPIRGEVIKAFVVIKTGIKKSEDLAEELKNHVKKFLAGHAYPREIEFIDKLPKTKSGKILRRVLKAQELGLSIGDTSTLEEF